MRFILISFLLLTSCAGELAKESETKLIGYTLPDILSCAGKPSSSIAITSNDVMIQYDQNTPVQPNFSLGGTSYGLNFSLGGMGECHMMIRLRNGYVTSIHYTGQSWTFGGELSACAGLINSCGSRSDHTSISSDYDQFEILGINKP